MSPDKNIMIYMPKSDEEDSKYCEITEGCLVEASNLKILDSARPSFPGQSFIKTSPTGAPDTNSGEYRKFQYPTRFSTSKTTDELKNGNCKASTIVLSNWEGNFLSPPKMIRREELSRWSVIFVDSYEKLQREENQFDYNNARKG